MPAACLEGLSYLAYRPLFLLRSSLGGREFAHVEVTAAPIPIFEAAKTVQLTKGLSFTPGRGLGAFFQVRAKARRDGWLRCVHCECSSYGCYQRVFSGVLRVLSTRRLSAGQLARMGDVGQL